MEILKKENYRIYTITRFEKDEKGHGDFVEKPVEYGLAIEKEDFFADADDKPVYYVICFIKYKENRECVEIENVGTRLFDIEKDEWPLFKELTKAACSLVEAANYKED